MPLVVEDRIISFLQMAHITTPLSKVDKELNFLTLLGRHLFNIHCYSFKAFLDSIVFRGSQSWKRNERQVPML
jgi:hypothetical protein